MNSIDVLWTTDPGLIALGILLAAFVLLMIAYATKFSLPFVIIDVVVWIAAAAVLGAVLGIWELPVLDYFNVVIETAV